MTSPDCGHVGLHPKNGCVLFGFPLTQHKGHFEELKHTGVHFGTPSRWFALGCLQNNFDPLIPFPLAPDTYPYTPQEAHLKVAQPVTFKTSPGNTGNHVYIHLTCWPSLIHPLGFWEPFPLIWVCLLRVPYQRHRDMGSWVQRIPFGLSLVQLGHRSLRRSGPDCELQSLRSGAHWPHGAQPHQDAQRFSSKWPCPFGVPDGSLKNEVVP